MIKKLNLCNYWIELENEKGLYEYCRGALKKCTCSGVKGQCNYALYFKSVGKNKKEAR